MYEYAIVVAACLHDKRLCTRCESSVLDLAMFQAMSTEETCRQDSHDMPMDIGFQLLGGMRLHQKRQWFTITESQVQTANNDATSYPKPAKVFQSRVSGYAEREGKS